MYNYNVHMFLIRSVLCKKSTERIKFFFFCILVENAKEKEPTELLSVTYSFEFSHIMVLQQVNMNLF